MIPAQAVEAAMVAFAQAPYLVTNRDQMTLALEAAAPHMQRTITTAEELDALPNGTVVMDGQGEVARKLVYGWRVLVSESGFDAWLSDPLEETYLPATILYEPQP